MWTSQPWKFIALAFALTSTSVWAEDYTLETDQITTESAAAELTPEFNADVELGVDHSLIDVVPPPVEFGPDQVSD
ncbi:MAG: hypothetical protein AB7P04_09970 [Bacteriovoracia bacterium]